MGNHYYEQRGQSTKLKEYAGYVRSAFNWIVSNFLSEHGIIQSWRDSVVNELILKVCDLAYSLKTLDRVSTTLTGLIQWGVAKRQRH